MIVDIEWRTIQFFLGEDGVHELSVDTDNPKTMRCSCQRFQRQAICKHVKFMRDKLGSRAEAVRIEIPDEFDDDQLDQIFSDNELFRDFVIKYGKTIVL